MLPVPRKQTVRTVNGMEENGEGDAVEFLPMEESLGDVWINARHELTLVKLAIREGEDRIVAPVILEQFDDASGRTT